MVQRTVLKVQLSCEKCKKKILKSISGLQGVDEIEIDRDKGTLTVTGDADPYEVIIRTKKAGKFVEVVTIGPPPAPPKKPEEKKPEGKKPEDKVDIVPSYCCRSYGYHSPHDCPVCHQIAVVHWHNQPHNPNCIIM